MDLRRLRAGEWIAAISGVVLIGSLWLPWWDAPSLDDASAWKVLATFDVLLLLLGLLGIGLLVVTAAASATAPGVAMSALLTPLALGMSVACLLRILDVPGGLESPGDVGLDVTTAYGAWIGLASCLGILVGTLVALRDERLSRPGAPTDSTGVPVAAHPEVEKLPGPPSA